MLTLHTAPAVRLSPSEPAAVEPGGAVAVDGAVIAAVGPLAELAARYPGARTRHWPGTLGPALVHDGPVPDAESPRERVHALLRCGVGTVTAASLDGDPEAEALRAAAVRVNLAVLPAARLVPLTEGGRADLAAFTEDGRCVATVLAGRLLHRRAW